MSLLAFPSRDHLPGGTVHVTTHDSGFQVAHESSSGGSWGGFEVYPISETAIAAAYAIARETYGGCEVAIWPQVLEAVATGARLPNHHSETGDF